MLRHSRTLVQPTSIRRIWRVDHAPLRCGESEVSSFLWGFLAADRPSNSAANSPLAPRDSDSRSGSRQPPVLPEKWPLFHVLAVIVGERLRPRPAQKEPTNSSPAIATPARIHVRNPEMNQPCSALLTARRRRSWL